jgi:hypothetical protein
MCAAVVARQAKAVSTVSICWLYAQLATGANDLLWRAPAALAGPLLLLLMIMLLLHLRQP